MSVVIVCVASLFIICHFYNSYIENKEYREIDTNNLLEQNFDYMGWLHIDDIIDLPVVQTDNNDFYLSHSFSKKKNKIGCLFIDKRVLPDSNNIIIHGHNNYDASMFSLLTTYEDKSFFNTHKIITFTTKDNEMHQYKVLAVLNYDISTMNEFNIYNPNITSSYIEKVKELSLYQSDISFSNEMNFITLSTCYEKYFGSDGRIIIIGAMAKH